MPTHATQEVLATATLTAALLVAGCTGWQPDRENVQPPVEELVLRRDGERLQGATAWAEIAALAGDRSSALEQLLGMQQRISGFPLVAGNDVTLLIDGPRTYDRIYDAITEAQHYVHLESFIVADDEVGEQLSRRLVDAVGRGVAVRLMFDGLGSVNTSAEYFDNLRSEGLQVREYNSPDPTRNAALWRINHRNHRKLAVVDGHTAFLGGINFAGVYASSSASAPGPEEGQDEGWRDTHLRVAGPVVADFAMLFARNWSEAGDPLPPDLAQPATDAPVGPYLVSALKSDGGDDDEFAIYETYLAAMRLAERRIWLTHAYFSPDKAFLETVEAAARRGIDVRILLPGFIDFEMILYASRSSYHRLLEAGVHIYERDDALLHAKTAVIDGVWSTVGSANLDVRSFVHNDEVNAVVVSVEFARQMEAQFEKDLARSREVTMSEWRQRPWRDRFLEWFSRRFNYWL